MTDLLVHRLTHAGGRLNVANFVSQNLHAPRRRGCTDAAQDGIVQRLPLFEGLVKGHLAELAAHGGLSQLGDGEDGVVNLVPGEMLP